MGKSFEVEIFFEDYGLIWNFLSLSEVSSIPIFFDIKFVHRRIFIQHFVKSFPYKATLRLRILKYNAEEIIIFLRALNT